MTHHAINETAVTAVSDVAVRQAQTAGLLSQPERGSDEHTIYLAYRCAVQALVAGGCACGCAHMPDLGPCNDFRQGTDGRCIHCGHGRACHL